MSTARAITLLLGLLLAAAHTAAAQPARPGRPFRLALPDKGWALDITLPPLLVERRWAPDGMDAPGAPSLIIDPTEELSDDGKAYTLSLHLTFGKKGPAGDLLIAFVTLRPAQAAGGAGAFRDHALKNLPKGFKLSGLKTWEHKEIPVARYRLGVLPGHQLHPEMGIPLLAMMMQTTQAYLVRDDVWVSLSLASADFGERERGLFNSLLDSLKFADTSSPPTSLDLYHKGRLALVRKDYRGASAALAEALELEKRERKLDTATWRLLLINLADAYSWGGALERSKEVLDFGAANDPANPVFHYALARYHAVQGDMDKVLARLELAFLNRENITQAAPMPDPAKDPAFERFKNDQRFRKAVKALKK